MHRIIYMRETGKYTVIYTDKDKPSFVLYMMHKKDEKIVHFSTQDGAEQAIENLGNSDFSLYYMGR